MTVTETNTVKQDGVVIDLVEGLLDAAFGLDAAVTLGLVEDYDFTQLQSQLLQLAKEAGGIAQAARAD